MVYQWYPGHMSKAKRLMSEDLKLIDCVVELLDARIPYSSKNPDIEHMAKDKCRVIVLNKSDLADPKVTKQFKTYYEGRGYYVCEAVSKQSNGAKSLLSLLPVACKEKIEKDKKRGIVGRNIRVMIVGIPNVGKSTLINSVSGKASAKTGNKPGVTKGKQWVKLAKGIDMLDTPGILWPKFENQEIGLRIALIGSISDELLNPVELAWELLKFLVARYPGVITEKYKVPETQDPVALLESICEKRACRKKGNELDLEKMSKMIIDDFRNGRIARICLETPEDIENDGETESSPE